jgi:MFS family permease
MVALFVQREDTNLFVALIPVATLLLMNFATSVPVGRIGQLFESVRIARFGYRCVAAVLGLLWIGWFVASDSVMLVYVLVGVALFLGHAWKQQREWLLWALIYAVVGLIFLMGELEQGKALWQSASGIIAVLMTQQLARRRERQFSMPELAHTVLILAGGIALFFWLTVKVFNSDWGGHSLLTLTWTILALGYLGLGLGLKERWYWLMGLGTLAIALLSVTIEFINGEAYWTSLLAIAVLFVGQQLARRRGNEVKVPDGVHKWLILVGGTLLFTWLSIKVSDPGDLGLSTLTWTILALGYFGFGLGWKERWFRLMGLGTLAIALVSLVPIIWGMKTEMKIASFFVMGLVFIGLGFVYTRFKDQIKKLL